MTVLSLKTLIGFDRMTVPSMTKHPAIFPNDGESNISLTSAKPQISSLITGADIPDIILLMSSMVS